MGKSVIVAEKFRVANTIAEVLGVQGYKNGYIENEDYIISWGVGHLVALAYPEDYDIAMKKWTLETLPFLPEEYRYKVIDTVKEQFSVIKEIYNRPDIDTIYYAPDAGREGIYIAALIRAMAGHNPNAEERVIWIHSHTDREILKGIREARLLSADKFQNLIASGYERGIEDYSTGINFSRVLSLLYAPMLNRAAGMTRYTPIAVGRVMTCVLGMIVNRELEIKNFKPIPFYKISNAITVDGVEIEADWKVSEKSKYYESPLLYNETGFKKEEDAKQFIAEIRKEVEIIQVENECERKFAPALFNLGELQAECSKKFKIGPDKTLEIAQTLYESKLTTYPRTDARVLSSAVMEEIEEHVMGLKNIFAELETYCDVIMENNWIKNANEKKYVDDSQITDHYAIIPTGEGGEKLEELSPLEKDVYELICRRFLSIFYPPAEYFKLTIVEKVDDELFTAVGKVLQAKGFYEIVGLPKNEDVKQQLLDNLKKIKQGETYSCVYDIKKGTTKAPKRYTSGNIVLAMENAGLLIEDEELRETIRKSGIGTSATRAETIKKLIKLEYICVNEKTQILTPGLLGFMIYEVILQTIPSLLNPKMTASWEKGLEQIASGELQADIYRKKMEAFVRKECDAMKSNEKKHIIAKNIKQYAVVENFEQEPEEIKPHATDARCPVCEGIIHAYPFGYACENYKKDSGCSFIIGKIAGIRIPENELESLINIGKTSVISGFMAKNKKQFSAMLVMGESEDGKPKIEFDFSENEQPILKNVLCPLCKSPIAIKPQGYGCSAYNKEDIDSCKFFVGAIAGKKLTLNQFKELIRKKKVGPVKGFKSKTGSKFEATLKMDKEGKISFDFPEPINEASRLECPMCTSKLSRTNWYYECNCGFKIPHTISKKPLTEQQVKNLIDGRTGLIKGFTSKKGKKFDAVLVRKEDGTIEFEF